MQLIVGLGVQFTPAPSGSGPPPADTLLLCVGQRCLIFRLSRTDRDPILLRRFLRKPSHTFVGFWNLSDRRKLLNSRHTLEMERDPLDPRLHLEVNGVGNLADALVDEIIEACLGFEVEQNKELSESNWNENSLSFDQVAYAVFDAYCAFVIGRNSMAWEVNE